MGATIAIATQNRVPSAIDIKATKKNSSQAINPKQRTSGDNAGAEEGLLCRSADRGAVGY
ncbi:hypothetical protein NBRC116187_18770 [Halopseudomonas sabulinigri]|uniref:Uncharacterized protein n=1 Tax=Halopseudomonas sabulinigri TaxID=472181 RepID=A0ABP9ZPY6_9GAMM